MLLVSGTSHAMRIRSFPDEGAEDGQFLIPERLPSVSVHVSSTTTTSFSLSQGMLRKPCLEARSGIAPLILEGHLMAFGAGAAYGFCFAWDQEQTRAVLLHLAGLSRGHWGTGVVLNPQTAQAPRRSWPRSPDLGHFHPKGRARSRRRGMDVSSQVCRHLSALQPAQMHPQPAGIRMSAHVMLANGPARGCSAIQNLLAF